MPIPANNCFGLHHTFRSTNGPYCAKSNVAYHCNLCLNSDKLILLIDMNDLDIRFLIQPWGYNGHPRDALNLPTLYVC